MYLTNLIAGAVSKFLNTKLPNIQNAGLISAQAGVREKINC